MRAEEKSIQDAVFAPPPLLKIKQKLHPPERRGRYYTNFFLRGKLLFHSPPEKEIIAKMKFYVRARRTPEINVDEKKMAEIKIGCVKLLKLL